MDAELAVNQVLDDEGLTSDLEEADATVLTRWLVAEVEKLARQATSEEAGWKQIKARRQQARQAARAVALFRDQGWAKASQYAQQEKLPWPAKELTSSQQVLEYLLHSMK